MKDKKIRNIENISVIYKILIKETKKYKVPVVDLIALETRDPFKILITTILSARTNDKNTLKAAKNLFMHVKNAKQLANMPLKRIEKLIKSVGFYRNKARYIKETAKIVSIKGVPDTMDDLLKLPGVGRKTANLVLIVAFNKYGICVDTHVHRIMNRLGLIQTKTPYETEMVLRKYLPKRYWKKINVLLVSLGQNVCRPLNPKCNICPIRYYCDYAKRHKIS